MPDKLSKDLKSLSGMNVDQVNNHLKEKLDNLALEQEQKEESLLEKLEKGLITKKEYMVSKNVLNKELQDEAEYLNNLFDHFINSINKETSSSRSNVPQDSSDILPDTHEPGDISDSFGE